MCIVCNYGRCVVWLSVLYCFGVLLLWNCSIVSGMLCMMVLILVLVVFMNSLIIEMNGGVRFVSLVVCVIDIVCGFFG